MGAAKRRLAVFHAARAIAAVQAPQMARLSFVSLGLRRNEVTGLVFENMDTTDEDNKWWHILYLDQHTGNKGDFDTLTGG